MVTKTLSSLQGPTINDAMTPGFNSDDPSTWPSHKKAFEMAKARTPSPPTTEEGVEEFLKKTAELLTQQMLEHPKTFTLNQPASLTVKRANGSYSKVPHIGGDTFSAAGAYVGKRRNIIYVFTPTAASDYVEMEMSEKDATTGLNGFLSYLKECGGIEFERNLADAKKAAADEAERAKLANRKDQYEDFGTW